MPNKRKVLKIEGANLWYLVGLIASDGSLSMDGRHINITSKDEFFLKKVILMTRLENKIGIKNKGKINQAFQIQFSNKNLYEFLLSVGLTPKKSLSLGKLDIPKEFFIDFLRGLIDGDGSIRSWIHPTNLHEQWSLRIFSGSNVFIAWLKSQIEGYFGCKGKIHSALRPERENLIYTLKYGKIAAKKILKNCYYKNALGLDRKTHLAQKCCSSYAGWQQSKTVFN